MNQNLFWLIPSFFIVAFLYGAVGHGGASGYLALFSLFAMEPKAMATSALCLNLLVSGLSFWAFWKSGHFSPSLTWPFIATSIPAALIGGMLHVSVPFYKMALTLVLVFAAYRLAIKTPDIVSSYRVLPRLSVALPTGAGIGLISGIVGIGGGIFLSPLLLLKNWGDPKRISATSALFIFVNSCAGLLGRLLGGEFQLGPWAPLVLAAFIGGVMGARLGANHFSGLTLRRLLAVVLGIAALKLIVT